MQIAALDEMNDLQKCMNRVHAAVLDNKEILESLKAQFQGYKGQVETLTAEANPQFKRFTQSTGFDNNNNGEVDGDELGSAVSMLNMYSTKIDGASWYHEAFQALTNTSHGASCTLIPCEVPIGDIMDQVLKSHPNRGQGFLDRFPLTLPTRRRLEFRKGAKERHLAGRSLASTPMTGPELIEYLGEKKLLSPGGVGLAEKLGQVTTASQSKLASWKKFLEAGKGVSTYAL